MAASTETRKVCSMADTYYLRDCTLHDTIGPVALWAAAHLMLHITQRHDSGSCSGAMWMAGTTMC